VKERIYVCHTYYNVYISILKEFKFQNTGNERGILALSLMSTDFKDLKFRIDRIGIFAEVIELNEVHPSKFQVKFKYATKGFKWWNPHQVYVNWVLYWRYVATQTGKYLNINFNDFSEVFVYCDSDPIGNYLNYDKIHYTAVEDGLESVRINDPRNQIKLLPLKIILAKIGAIFMKDGFSRFAKGIEVNSANGLYSFGRKLIEVPRKSLLESASYEQKSLLYDVFCRDMSFSGLIPGKPNAILLAGQLADTENSFTIYRDIIKEYGAGYNVIIKPHPIDESDYESAFPNCIVLERYFPLEIFNVRCDVNIERMISVTSVLDDYTFAKEKIRLGLEYLKKYDYPNMLTQPGDIVKR